MLTTTQCREKRENIIDGMVNSFLDLLKLVLHTQFRSSTFTKLIVACQITDITQLRFCWTTLLTQFTSFASVNLLIRFCCEFKKKQVIFYQRVYKLLKKSRFTNYVIGYQFLCRYTFLHVKLRQKRFVVAKNGRWCKNRELDCVCHQNTSNDTLMNHTVR